MADEREFLQKCLVMVMRQLQANDSGIRYEGHGKGRKTTLIDEVTQDKSYQREARLLSHIIKRIEEGQVQSALRQWRRKFGAYLVEHRERYKEVIDAYDTWWSLPYAERERVRKPPRPPQATYKDQSGDTRIIDDAFLILLDDLSSRLEKWLQED